MNFENNEQKTKRLSKLLSTVEKNMTKPDKQFIDKLREQSTTEFLEFCETDRNKQKTTFSIWRIIMKNKMIKFTAAAVIIIAIAAGINRFGFKVQMTSPAIAQIINNTKKMPWMHAVLEGTVSPGQSLERLEAWAAFESEIYASKPLSGITGFMQGKVKYEYNPSSQTITISNHSNDTLKQMGSILGYWERIMKMFSDAEAQIIKEKGKYQGRKAIIYNVNVSLGGQPHEISMIIDANKELPVSLNQKVLDADGQVITEINGYFDYPDNGPSNIYDLGVPQDAKVIDKTQNEK